jgi:hypothetical protein
MQGAFASDITIVIESGYIYLPLLYDPSIEEEIDGGRSSGSGPNKNSEAFHLMRGKLLIRVNGKYFVRSLNLQSLLDNYPRLHPEHYKQIKSSQLKKYVAAPYFDELPIDEKLETILFHIMPHYIRRKTQLRRRKPSTEEILDYIEEKMAIPDAYYDRADRFFAPDHSLDFLRGLQRRASVDLPGRGPISPDAFDTWLQGALTAKIVNDEIERLTQRLRRREESLKDRRRYTAALLFIADKGSFERDGFGFYRTGTKDYIIYKRTGEYALKDYYGRIYLFPDCRVAVLTHGFMHPIILDRYKHPFLEEDEPGQQICLGLDREMYFPRQFTAKNVVKALEEGISTLFYGYNSRKRNGYHSLDTTADTATARFRSVNFDDYRIPKDHPKVVSGEVEIKNAFN